MVKVDDFYTDTVDVWRPQKIDDEDGGRTDEDFLLYSGIKCMLDRESSTSTEGYPVNSTTQTFTLFTHIDTDIQQNDKLIVYRGNEKYTFRAGLPFAYYHLLPHKEIVMSEVLENEDKGDG